MREAGYPIKVAVIHSAIDLGTLASAFGRPQQHGGDQAAAVLVGVLVLAAAFAGLAARRREHARTEPA